MAQLIADVEFRRRAQEAVVSLGLPRDYESEQLEHLGRLLQQANRFIDVGANHGLYARLANQAIRNGYIALVEANPELAERLRREVPTWPRDNGNKIEVFPVAAGDAPARLPFLLDDSDVLSRIDLERSEAGGRRYVEVQCEALDSLFAPAEGTVIKIDVEGFEYRVVLGAKRLLSKGARVILELHGWGDGKKYPVHVFWLMYTLGFAGRRIGNSYSCDFVQAGFAERSALFLRAWPKLALKYALRRLGLRRVVYRVLWPGLVDSAGK